MKRRTFLQSCTAGAMTLLMDSPVFGQAAETSLEQAFLNPPSSAGPQTWWHWMNGNVSRTGITLDLESMKRVGCSGFQLFQVGTGMPLGPAPYGSPEHLALVRHAAQEADRLGLAWAMHNCPGWSSSGGPWITERPELSMQMLTWTETPVAGGRRVSIRLPQPAARSVTNSKGTQPYYRDAMVLAFPEPASDPQPSAITTNAGPVDANLLSGAAEGVSLQPSPGNSAFLQIEFAAPVAARSILLSSASAAGGAGRGGRGAAGPAGVFALEASSDGSQFRRIANLAGEAGRGGAASGAQFPTTVNLPGGTRARFFRIVSSTPRQISSVRISAAPRVDNWTSKAGHTPRGRGGAAAPPSATPLAGPFINPAAVTDITQFMDPQGQLVWQAPAGNWTILRIGHTTNLAEVGPAPDGGIGLECDKFSREAFEFHFNQFFGPLFDVIQPLAAKKMAGATIDSYERGVQSWTPRFPEEFQKRRGYDMRNYMPAMFGHVVGDAAISDRFLWDVRKTQAELQQEYYYGAFQELCHQHGIESYIEPYSPGNFDEMPAGSYADMVMGEFWLGQAGSTSVKLAASVAHVYDKRIVGAESFTSQSKWQEHPYNMKTLGDYIFTQGLNNYVFHCFAHQPHPTAGPGMSMGPFGWYFNRANTWYEKSGGWLKGYVTRCQSMLRQGEFVGDLLYFTGEDSPQSAPSLAQLEPPPPEGYDWDTIDSAAILNLARIENGRIALPGGASYAVLVLRNSDTLSLPLARKLRDLVNDGMNLVVTSKPSSTPGLADYPAADENLRQAVAELWGDLDGAAVTERRLGRGRLFWPPSMQTVVDRLGIKPDFEFTAKAPDAPVSWIHRRSGDADFYFIASRRRSPEELVCTFRVNGKRPELWDARTGEIARTVAFETVDDRIRVPIRLEQAGSLFVVFRPASPGRQLRQIAKDGSTLVTTQPFPKPAPGLHGNVANNFAISLWIKPDMEGAIPNPGPPAGAAFGGGGGGRSSVSYVVFPPSGETLYGANHAACGIGASRNGVAVYERGGRTPAVVASVSVPIAGWTHVAVVYREGAPSLYVGGRLVGQAEASGRIVHPGLGEAYDAPVDFMGQSTEPELIAEAITEARVRQLAGAGLPAPLDPPACEPSGSGLLVWQDGNYTLLDSAGRSTTLPISGIGAPIEIAGPWTVRFPPNLGAPAGIVLPELQSLHRHAEPGVKYFSGVAAYTKRLEVPAGALGPGKRLFLDLGRVEVVADVRINGTMAGNVWKPPYRLDITDLVHAGGNNLEIEVANLWPNRLIGDELLPPEYEYSGVEFGSPAGRPRGDGQIGAILALPDWYLKGEPKPPGGRIAFPCYRWYNSKDDPLFESGLLGPVRLRAALLRQIDM